MSKIKNQAVKLGRPPRHVSFPKQKFTVNFLFNREKRFERPISKVALTTKVNHGVQSGVLKRIGKIVGKKGRPSIQYVRVK